MPPNTVANVWGGIVFAFISIRLLRDCAVSKAHVTKRQLSNWLLDPTLELSAEQVEQMAHKWYILSGLDDGGFSMFLLRAAVVSPVSPIVSERLALLFQSSPDKMKQA